MENNSIYQSDYYIGYSASKQPYTWEQERPYKQINANHIISLFHPKKVLDIGCAHGFQVRVLRELGIDAYGCDISGYAVEQARKEDRPYLEVCDITRALPKERDFDVVFSDACFEHIRMESIPAAFKNISFLTNNYFVLFIPTTPGLINEPWGDPTHVTYMPASWWISEAWKVGFQVDMSLSVLEYEAPKFYILRLFFTKKSLSIK